MDLFFFYFIDFLFNNFRLEICLFFYAFKIFRQDVYIKPDLPCWLFLMLYETFKAELFKIFLDKPVISKQNMNLEKKPVAFLCDFCFSSHLKLLFFL